MSKNLSSEIITRRFVLKTPKIVLCIVGLFGELYATLQIPLKTVAIRNKELSENNQHLPVH